MVGHPCFASVEQHGIDDCVVGLDFGVSPETVICKNMLKQFPQRRGNCLLYLEYSELTGFLLWSQGPAKPFGGLQDPISMAGSLEALT